MSIVFHVLCRSILFRLMSSVIILTILLGTFSITVTYASGPSSFSIEPSFYAASGMSPRAYFTYNTNPGAHTYDSIHVTNGGLTRGTVKLYAVDAITGQTSGTSVRPRQEQQVDVGAWIILDHQQITLNPGQSEDVPFTLIVPLHVRPGQHGGVIIAEDLRQEHITPSTSGNGTKIGIGIQSFIGLGVLVNLPGPTVERLNVMGISFDEQSTHQRLLINLGNTGTQLLHPSGSLQIKDDQGHILQNLPIAMDTFLPQTAINYPIYIQHKALNPGKSYHAILHLTYEKKHILNYMQSFYVPLVQKEPITNLVQSLVTSPEGNIFSILTPWHYAIGLAVLFFILSASFFWVQKIRLLFTRIVRKK